MTNSYVHWKAWQAQDFGRVDAESAAYYAQELRVSGVLSVRGLTVGELGYGNGTFAGWVREAGGRWVGREAIPELNQRAAKAGFEVLDPKLDFSTALGPDSLDVLAAFDVVEHLDIPQIRAFLSDAAAVLKPGGWLLVRLPSGDSPFSQAIYRGDLTHQTLLGSNAVRQLASLAGLQVRQIRAPVLPLVGTGIWRAFRRATVSLARAVAFRFIGSVLMGNAAAVLAPNMFLVLRKPGGNGHVAKIETSSRRPS
jgi:SAM-dependent methyltransferase